ncbi:MAG: anhydro-N-acetylmuramic acid kinase [bacterium]
MKPIQYFAGIMTGTSLDAIDIVIADLSGFPKVLFHASYAFEPYLRNRLSELASRNEISIDLFVATHFELSKAYANGLQNAINESGITADQIRAIGMHGQTIRHLPQAGATFQLGSAPALAALTGIDVISDFRSADMALGGQGAPLMPMFDYHFLSDTSSDRIILNIGGIANLTYLPRSGSEENVIAFDCGPGNMLIDALAQRYFNQPFDAEGGLASQGVVNESLLRELLALPYFSASPPKSTGRELFGEPILIQFTEHVTKSKLSAIDAICTATELTARTIAGATTLLPSSITDATTELIISGGGTRNVFLMHRIRTLLPEMKLRTSDEIGIPSQSKEALAFAWFAKAFIDDQTIHLPTTTGASRKIILGSLSKGK